MRIFAYIMRFIQRIKWTNEGFTRQLTVTELRLAFLKLVEIEQNPQYKSEKASLKENKPLSSNLQKLKPFIHEFRDQYRSYEILRVGGRLMNSELSYDAKFPLLLTK